MKIKGIVLFLLSGILFSCDDKEDNDCSIAYSTELQVEINALTTAAQLYGTTPNVANCTAYKTSFQVFINKLEPYGNAVYLKYNNDQILMRLYPQLNQIQIH